MAKTALRLFDICSEATDECDEAALLRSAKSRLLESPHWENDLAITDALALLRLLEKKVDRIGRFLDNHSFDDRAQPAREVANA